MNAGDEVKKVREKFVLAKLIFANHMSGFSIVVQVSNKKFWTLWNLESCNRLKMWFQTRLVT